MRVNTQWSADFLYRVDYESSTDLENASQCATITSAFPQKPIGASPIQTPVLVLCLIWRNLAPLDGKQKMPGPSPIRSLPIDLQNQIAAGEVVERPASVLKELVENALDAQATRIRVHIRDGGQSCIRVSDNGYGIAEDQLALALTRHATSKISSLNDLTTIHSFGFRGEALPSIASVSRFSLASAQANGEGMAVESVFGSLSQPIPAALPRGTDVEVRDLFANVPARLKFLKQPSTEARKCSDILARMALAHPDLDVELLMGERSAFHFLAGQSLAQRLSAVWPPQLLHNLAEVNFFQDQLSVTGLAGAPASAQARADRIYLYVNKRPVQDKTMLSAVREAYRGRILGKEYPQAVIFLELPPKRWTSMCIQPRQKFAFRMNDTFSRPCAGQSSWLWIARPMALSKHHSFIT